MLLYQITPTDFGEPLWAVTFFSLWGCCKNLQTDAYLCNDYTDQSTRVVITGPFEAQNANLMPIFVLVTERTDQLIGEA
mgnify:CR=1 FL=1